MVYINQKLLSSLSLLLACSNTFALTIEDVEIPEKIKQPASNQTLLLNGAGVRNKFVFSIYVGALYLLHEQNSLADILEKDEPNRVAMYFLYDKLDREKLTNAWQEGFEENNTKVQMQVLQQRLDNFNQLFKTVVKGDAVMLDYIPEQGTSVRINNVLQGNVPGRDFNQALLKVWLGNEPADADLKDAMLGTRQED